jgi:hypothetical protein
LGVAISLKRAANRLKSAVREQPGPAELVAYLEGINSAFS